MIDCAPTRCPRTVYGNPSHGHAAPDVLVFTTWNETGSSRIVSAARATRPWLSAIVIASIVRMAQRAVTNVRGVMIPSFWAWLADYTYRIAAAIRSVKGLI